MKTERTSSARRALAYLGAGFLVLVIIGGAAVGLFVFEFHMPPPKANYPAPASALEAQRQDLDYFRKLLSLDRSFSQKSRAAAEKRIGTLQELSTPLPRARLQVALMQVMASADNGHTRMDPIADEGTLVLPVRVTRFEEGFFVMRAAPGYRDMLGGRVESIDGIPFDLALARVESLRGGVPGFRRENASVNVVVQDLLYGLGIAVDPKASVWAVRLPDGTLVTHKLAAYPLKRGDQVPHGVRWLSPEPARKTESDWIAYHPASGVVPETWRHFDTHFRVFYLPQSCAKVIRLQDISDTDGQKISPFLNETEIALRKQPPCGVIVDLRGNTGGDYTNTWNFSHALPGLVKPGGRIIVLTDPETFSAAITTAAFIKDAGKDVVTIVGEPIGDRLSFYSEGGTGCLPNLKICVHYEVARHDYAHACTDWRQCYWLNWFYPVRINSLQPDILVPQRFLDWNNGHDAAFDRAALLIASRDPLTAIRQ
jgi:hypothetical protein